MAPAQISAFAPHTALIQRELRTLLRNPRVFAGVGAFTGLLALTCASSYPYGSNSATQMAVLFGQTMVQQQLTGLWLAALIALPAMAILGLHQDSQSGVLEHIAVTPMRPRALYWAKGLALALLFLLSAAAVLPLSGIAFFLAGVEVRTYLGQLVTVFAFAACMLVLAIQVAARVPATISALVRTILAGLTAGGGAFILATRFQLSPFTLYVLGFTAAALLSPAIIRRIAVRGPGTPWFERARAIRTPAPRLPADFRDDANPVAVKDSLLFGQRGHTRRLRRILFITGLGAGLAVYSGMLGVFVSYMWALSYLFDLLIFGSGAVFAAIVCFQDSDPRAIDALRTTLLDDRTYLDGKMRAAWGAAWPLIAGWAAGCGTMVLITSLFRAGMFSAPISLVQFLFILLIVPRFHITFLLAAAGTTFGRNAITSMASAMAWSAGGHLVLRALNSFMTRFIFNNAFSGMNWSIYLYAAAHAATLAAAFGAAVYFARWRFRRVWQGSGE
jgi:hypothetical protein